MNPLDEQAAAVAVEPGGSDGPSPRSSAPPLETEQVATDVGVFTGAIASFLATRIVLEIVGLLALSYIGPLIRWSLLPSPNGRGAHLPSMLWTMWDRFDSVYYLDIAARGYSSQSSPHVVDWAFYPLYPTLVHPLGLLFGSGTTAYQIAGILVANAAAVVAVVYLYLLVRADFGARTASRTVLYLALFPTAFFLSAVYSESVFLACCAATMYYMRRHSWWVAGICAGLATLARAPGVLLILPLAWEYGQAALAHVSPSNEELGFERRDWTHRVVASLPGLARAMIRPSTLSLLLPLLGFFGFLVYGDIRTGDLMITSHIESVHWGRKLAWPWVGLFFALRHPHAGDPLNWNFWALDVASTLLFLGLLVVALRRLPGAYFLYMLVIVLISLSTGFLNSVGRYLLVAFPAFILLALMEQRWGSRFSVPVLTLFASTQAILLLFYLLGLPAVA